MIYNTNKQGALPYFDFFILEFKKMIQTLADFLPLVQPLNRALTFIYKEIEFKLLPLDFDKNADEFTAPLKIFKDENITPEDLTFKKIAKIYNNKSIIIYLED